MSINQKIISTLSSLDIPVSFQSYSGKADPYLTFFIYLDKTEQHADDEDLNTGYYIQLDIWTKGDYTELVKNVHQKMNKAGFSKMNFYDLYENDLKVYHKVMRYFILKEE